MNQDQNLPNTGSITRKPSSIFLKITKLFFIAFIACAVCVCGLLAYYYFTSPVINDAVKIIVTGIDKPSKAFPGENSINLLLMGRDFDRDNKGQIVDTKGRTDCMMLAHVDFISKSVDILSIPRDTLVKIPGYRHKNRISYANAYGGPQLAINTVSEFLGVKPTHYMLVNFNGFEDAIDKMGGLEINVDKKLDYDDNWGNLHIHLEPGKQVLNGEQAMGFVRYRKSNEGGGDSDLIRIGRQQLFMSALKNRLSSPEVALKIPMLLNSVKKDLEGSLTSAQMICLARFMKSLPPNNGIKMHVLPTTEDSLIYIHADEIATKKLVDDIFLRD